MLSTTHQRNLLDFFKEKKTASLELLKEKFVTTNTMNQTTLYRILDRWKSENMIYEIEVDKKRIFLFCDHHHENMGVKISYCKNCEEISETHFPLDKNVESAESIEFLKKCNCCNN